MLDDRLKYNVGPQYADRFEDQFTREMERCGITTRIARRNRLVLNEEADLQRQIEADQIEVVLVAKTEWFARGPMEQDVFVLEFAPAQAARGEIWRVSIQIQTHLDLDFSKAGALVAENLAEQMRQAGFLPRCS